MAAETDLAAQTTEPLPVLLIEDHAGDVRLVQELLKQVEGQPFKLTVASRLAEGLELLRREPFAAVLLDLSLPDCRGLDTFLELHRHAPQTPAIVMTGFNDELLAVKAVQEGAEDYLVKGYVNSNLLVRSLRYAIERARRRLAEHAARVAAEQLQVLRDVQQYLLPRTLPALPGFDLAAGCCTAQRPCGAVGDLLPRRDERWGLVLGVGRAQTLRQALILVEVRAQLRALAQTSLDLANIFAIVSSLLAVQIQDEPSVALYLGELDLRSRTLHAICAGQLTAQLLDAAGAVKHTLTGTVPPLRGRADDTYSISVPLKLDAGDVLFVRAAEAPQELAAHALTLVREQRAEQAAAILHQVHTAMQTQAAAAQSPSSAAMIVKVL